jgi:uncharacterized membrane protein
MINDQTMLSIAGTVAQVFELAGIAVVILGACYAAGAFLLGTIRGQPPGDDRIAAFRRALGRAILTGLELLVAADIIRTVALDPTLQSVLVLGLIVIIRTFLSFSLEVEIDGRWPWQKDPKDTAPPQRAAEERG